MATSSIQSTPPADHWTTAELTVTVVSAAVGAPQVQPRPVDQETPSTPVTTRPWDLTLTAPTGAELTIGEEYTFTLTFTPALMVSENTLRIPTSAREVILFVEASGFHLAGEPQRSIQVTADGIVQRRQVAIQAAPLLSGQHTLRVAVYVGATGVKLHPIRLAAPVIVAPPEKLAAIPELIDRRTIPAPQPDVMFYVALEETPHGQQLKIHVTCAALGLDRERMEPLPFGCADITLLRQAALHAAARANQSAPSVARLALQLTGAMLYDQLLPPASRLRTIYTAIARLAALSNRPLNSLIVADEGALLPWEWVLPYDQAQIEDFWGARYNLAHWVGRQNFPLYNEAPLGMINLAHYRQQVQELPRWQRALGGQEVVDFAQQADLLAFSDRNAPFYGLHILRYSENRRAGQIATATPAGNKPTDPKAAVVDEQRLDFARRRPVVGLSFVQEPMPAPAFTGYSRDLHLESSWVIPLLHAGSSALVGARWPVAPAVDQAFFGAFYAAMRRGSPLGAAVLAARSAVRLAFPERTDWLAYTYFGHPACEPYLVQPAEGYALFEVLNYPENQPLQAGVTYEFRASYLAQAPTWYRGRVHRQPELKLAAPTVMVVPMNAAAPQLYPLSPIGGGVGYEATVPLTMPDQPMTFSVVVCFQDEEQELQTLVLNLAVRGE